MTTQEESYLRAVQATLLERLRGLLGTSYDDPILQIKHVIGSVYGQNSCYGLFIYGEKHPVPAQEQDTSYTFIVRIGHDHCRSDHYLYGKIMMEGCDDKWLIHSVTVAYRPVPEKYNDLHEHFEDITGVRRVVNDLHLQIRSARGILDTLNYDGSISRRLEFLTSKISSIWTFLKWHQPWTPLEEFIQSGLTILLGYERYKKVQFKAGEDGELIVELYYKGDLILAHKIYLSESLEDLLQ